MVTLGALKSITKTKSGNTGSQASGPWDLYKGHSSSYPPTLDDDNCHSPTIGSLVYGCQVAAVFPHKAVFCIFQDLLLIADGVFYPQWPTSTTAVVTLPGP